MKNRPSKLCTKMEQTDSCSGEKFAQRRNDPIFKEWLVERRRAAGLAQEVSCMLKNARTPLNLSSIV